MTNTYVPTSAGGPYGTWSTIETTGLFAGGSAPAAATASEVGTAASGGDGSVFLTPDVLLAYCQARLTSIDSQVRGAFGSQQLRNSETSAIQTALNALQENAGGVTNDATSCTAMEKALHDLIEQLKATDPGCPELGKLKQTYNNLVYTGTGPTSDLPYEDESLYPPKHSGPLGDKTIDSTEMQGFTSSLQSCASDLNSSSELQMIQLQSLMSQRQTAIQLTTNLVQSLGDQAQKIAENVGR
jgi:hypothetical protein